MTDLSPDPPATGAPAEPSSIKAVVSGVCPTCEYDLKGLPIRGVCPECGTEYDGDTLFSLESLPSALSLCLRYGWPLLLVVMAGAPAAMGPADESLVCCGLIGLVMIPINGILQAMILRNHPVMSREYLRAVSPRVRRLSHICVALFIMTVVLPLVIFGGCVLIVLASLAR